jgi:hypothetical protein
MSSTFAFSVLNSQLSAGLIRWPQALSYLPPSPSSITISTASATATLHSVCLAVCEVDSDCRDAAYGSAREMLTIEAVGSGHQVLAYVNDDEIYDLLETTSPLTHEQLREKLQHVKFVPSSPWVRTPPNSATE